MIDADGRRPMIVRLIVGAALLLLGPVVAIVIGIIALPAVLPGPATVVTAAPTGIVETTDGEEIVLFVEGAAPPGVPPTCTATGATPIDDATRTTSTVETGGTTYTSFARFRADASGSATVTCSEGGPTVIVGEPTLEGMGPIIAVVLILVVVALVLMAAGIVAAFTGIKGLMRGGGHPATS